MGAFESLGFDIMTFVLGWLGGGDQRPGEA